jgi:peptidyl-prolyl cis-trans isomerase B (cyclophilin B)
MRAGATLLTLLLALVACSADPTPSPRPPCPTEAPTAVSAQATLEGASYASVTVAGAVSGEFEIALAGDDAPIATANFVALARCGFYDGITFHRVLAGFVIQAGDPGTRDHDGDFAGLGQGGPGYGFEIEPPAAGQRYAKYAVAMANNGESNGSQWFVTLDDLDAQLRAVGTYTILGAVDVGTDIIDAIAAVPVNDPRIGVPLSPVSIQRIEIRAEGGVHPSDGG